MRLAMAAVNCDKVTKQRDTSQAFLTCRQIHQFYIDFIEYLQLYFSRIFITPALSKARKYISSVSMEIAVYSAVNESRISRIDRLPSA
jgi:hypothetical protein